MSRSTLTQAELGRALGISQAMTSRLLAAGMPRDVEGAKAWRKRNLDPRLVRRRRRAPRPSKAAAPGKGVDWRDRRDRAIALLREAEVAQLRGELIPIKGLKAKLEACFSVTRQRMLAVPSRVASRLSDPALQAKVAGLVEVEIHSCLTEISGFDPEKSGR